LAHSDVSSTNSLVNARAISTVQGNVSVDCVGSVCAITVPSKCTSGSVNYDLSAITCLVVLASRRFFTRWWYAASLAAYIQRIGP
jgi:hypothetical protein